MREELNTPNMKKYLKLYKKYEETNDTDVQDDIQEKIDELWYELDGDEIAFIEINNLTI